MPRSIRHLDSVLLFTGCRRILGSLAAIPRKSPSLVRGERLARTPSCSVEADPLLHSPSAGGVSVTSQMVAYGGRDDGLFSGAIINSGVFATQNSSLASQNQAWSNCES